MRRKNIRYLFFLSVVLVAGCGDYRESGAQLSGDSATETPAPPAASCSGNSVGGFCWYLGASNASCTTTCSTHGGYNDATRTYAGDQGTLAGCSAVLVSLTGAGANDSASGTNLGCYKFGAGARRRETLGATTEGAAAVGAARACACNE